MKNQLKQLINTILAEEHINNNLSSKLIKNLTGKPKQYYSVLNKRVKNGEKLDDIELSLLQEQIKHYLDTHKTVINVKFKGDAHSHPTVIVPTFDTAKIEHQIAKWENHPGVEYVATHIMKG